MLFTWLGKIPSFNITFGVLHIISSFSQMVELSICFLPYNHVVDPNSKKYDSQIAQTFSRCLKVIIEISKNYCSEDVQIQIQE